MTTLHNYLIRTLSVYHNWHQTKHHNKIHWGVLVVFTLLIFGMILRWTPISFAADTAAPTTPTNLTATPISSSQINLSWTASTDDTGVTGYKIYRCAGSACAPTTLITTSATNSYSNTGLTASTAYTYAVSAYDAAGNESGKSTQTSATTQAALMSLKIYQCNPSSDIATNYKWDPMNFTTMADGKLTPTAASWSIVIPNQEGQIALDTFRNKKIAFVSGVTLEAPAGTENYTVVPVTNCPPAVWGGSLIYDPINKEAVLIGGTLSVNGGTEGTWIYSPQLADWYKLNPSSTYVKQVRSNVDQIKTDLNKLRWDLWKAIEWKTSGRTSDIKTPAVLKSELDSIKTNLQTTLTLANTNQSLASIAYEKSQLQGAATWIQDAINKLSTAGPDLSGGVAENMEKDYRLIVNAYTSIENTEDSLLGEPQPRYFSTVAYDALQNAITVNGGKHNSHSWNDSWIYLVNEHRWERKNPLPGAPFSNSKINVLPTTGDYVLRDNATTIDLKNYKSSMDSWSSAVSPNTWVMTPTNGTGRPNWGRSWSSIIYDPDRQQIYYRDGGHGSYHGSVTDHYDIPTGRWFRSAQLEEPDGALMGTYVGWGRSYTFSPWATHTYKYSLFYNPLVKRLQRIAIFSPYKYYDQTRGVPVNNYNPDTGEWSPDFAYIPPGDDPSITGTPFASPLIPGVPDGLIGVHAFDRYNPRSTAYVWYKNAIGIKEWNNTGALPFPHEDHHSSFFFDPLRKKIMYYGGNDIERGIFAFDTTSATSKWVKLNATVFGGAALPYPSREVVYLPKYDIFLFLEGWINTYGDTRPPTIWSFDPKNNEFRKVDLSIGFGVTALPSAGISSGLAYDPVSDLVFYTTASNNTPTMFAFRYSPFPTDTTAPSLPSNLTSTAISPSQINLSWTVSTDTESGVSYYNIYRDNVYLNKSTVASFSDINLQEGTTYSYQVSAVNGAGLESAKSTAKSAATLSDTSPPVISSVSAAEPTKVSVIFSEPVEQISAANISNYSINNGITVSSASLGLDVKTVTLTTSALSEGVSYILIVNNIKDRAKVPNTILLNSQKTFTYSSGLIAYYKLDETTGLIVQDSSGNNNTGTLTNGPTWTIGKAGGAVSLDGINDYIDMPSLNVSTGAVTFTAWVNGSRTGEYSGILYSRNDPQSVGIGYQSGSNNLTYTWNNNSASTYLFSGPAIPINEWALLAVSIEPTKATLYVISNSGVSTFVNTIPHSVQTFNGRFRIGNDAYDSARSFKGIIDDVRIYNRALAQTEIQALYGSVPPPPLPAKFKIGDLVETTANLNVRATPSVAGALFGTQILGSKGTIIGGPTIADGFTWWQIDYDNAPDGWSVEDWLQKYISLLPPPPGSLNIPLTVQEVLPQGVTGMNRTSEPVTVGIPLAEDSGITNINQLGLTGASAGQFRALAFWPNNNIKWVLVDTQADVAAGSQNATVSLTGGTGNFGGSNLAMDSGAIISVNTGPAQFTIKKSNFNVFDSAVVNGQTLVNTGNNGRVVMRDQNDIEFSSANDSLSIAVIEENGPVKTVIKATGSFKNSQGTRLMDYTLRIHFYKGKSYVKSFVTLRNAKKDYPSHVLFNSAEIIIPLNLGVNKTVEFARKIDTVAQNLSSTDTAYLYQGYSTDRLGYDTKGCAGGAYGWNPPVPGTCDANDQYVFDLAQSGLKIQAGATALNSLGNQDDWTQGYAKLSDSSNAGISVSYRYMSSYWPAGFEFKGSGETSIELFSKQNSKKNLKFAFGAYETREIMWDFFTAANDSKKTLYNLQYPLVARAPFSHYMATKAIYGQSEFVTPEQQNKFFSDIGRPDLSPVLANPPFNRLFRFWSWRAGGGMNQTDFPLNDLQDFLRTGFGGYYLWGEQRTLYNSDNAVSHSDDFSIETNFTISDPANTIETMNGDTFDMEHAHMLSIPFYYYLTGNEQIKETVLDYGELLDRMEITNYFGLIGTPYFRAWLRKYRNLAIIYEFSCYTQTCNTRYKNYIESASNFLLDSRDNPSSGTLYPKGRNLERGYIYWDTETSNSLGYRMLGSLVHVQMTTEAIWQAMRIMGDTNWNYARKEEMEDMLLGLDQFLFNEAYVEFNGGDAIGEFGFHYFYPLDKSYTPTTVDTTPYDGSRAALYAYKRTGDPSFLIKAKKLSWAITEYATSRSPSELQDQALMYAHFNLPLDIWKSLSFVLKNNGSGSYTLSWTVPQNAAQYQIKYSDKPIVDWLGFDKVTRIYQYDPAQYTAFFAASNISNEPTPTSDSSAQTFNLSGLSCGNNCYFAIKYLSGSVILLSSDTTAPSVPTNLTASSISSSQINLSWTASTDDVGVAGYNIYRCAGLVCAPTTQIATSTTNSYSNTGLTSSTAYTYAVSAYDAAGNESGKSSSVLSTTLFQFKQADFNKDGVVNQLDLDILKQEWNRTDKPASDLNQDGIVNSQDLGILMSQWSK